MGKFPMALTIGVALCLSRLSRPAFVSMLAKPAPAFRNPHNLPTKTCVVCGRQFTWRKKWERDWENVLTSSKRCNSERKKAKGRAESSSEGETSDETTECVASKSKGKGRSRATRMLASAEPEGSKESGLASEVDPKAIRRAAKKAVKADRRAVREGRGMQGTGQKGCDICARKVDLLVRCKIRAGNEWKMVCGRCWNTPAVAGGVVDGDGTNPHYVYGGLWKNQRKQRPVMEVEQTVATGELLLPTEDDVAVEHQVEGCSEKAASLLVSLSLDNAMA